MLPLNSNSVVVASRDQVSCEVAGEIVVLQMTEGAYYGLDGVGTTVWKRLQEPSTVADLEAAILLEYQVDPETCRADLAALLQDLLEKGLVRLG